jgi:hypothetical protein
MIRRFILSIAAVLAIGACSDQQEPNTANPNSEPEFASSSGNTQINVALKSSTTPAHRTELSKYGTIYDEIPQLNVVLMRADKRQIAAIGALPFVESVGTDAERDIGPIDLIPPGTTDFAGSNNVWNLDAVNVTDKLSPGRKVAQDGSNVYVAVLDTGLLPSWRAYSPRHGLPRSMPSRSAQAPDQTKTMFPSSRTSGNRIPTPTELTSPASSSGTGTQRLPLAENSSSMELHRRPPSFQSRYSIKVGVGGHRPLPRASCISAILQAPTACSMVSASSSI